MRSIRLAGLLALLALVATACSDPAPPAAADSTGPFADLVLLDGNVITLDPQQPRAEAVAIRGSRIMAVGDDATVRGLIGPDTRTQLLFGRTLVPGFIDAHVHFLRIGERLVQVDASGADKQAILDQVAQRAAVTPPGEWILGRGWDQNLWDIPEFPTALELDAAAPQNPVFLTRTDAHAAWVNSEALERAAIVAETPDPVGGEIVRDVDGEPTGTLVDAAMRLVTRRIPPPSRAERIQSVQLATQEALAAGVTSVHDAGSSVADAELFRYLAGIGLLDLRVYSFLRWPSAEDDRPFDYLDVDEFLSAGPTLGMHGNRVSIGGIKMSVDGALGSRGAALLEPYEDDPDHRGLFLLSPEEVTRTLRRALAADFQVAVHAIGDAGNRAVLDAIAAVLAETDVEDHRLRIEHAQILHPDDLVRFAELGVVPSMQPSHATSDMRWVPDRIGEERARTSYAWNSLLETGVRIPGGSDAPVEPLDPIAGIHAAVTRREPGGWPEGGWNPQERVEREQALRMFTIDAAWSVFEEDLKGTIEPGKLADLVLLSNDILEVPAEELLDTEVLVTWFDGEMRYQNRALATIEAEAAAEGAAEVLD